MSKNKLQSSVSNGAAGTLRSSLNEQYPSISNLLLDGLDSTYNFIPLESARLSLQTETQGTNGIHKFPDFKLPDNPTRSQNNTKFLSSEYDLCKYLEFHPDYGRSHEFKSQGIKPSSNHQSFCELFTSHIHFGTNGQGTKSSPSDIDFLNYYMSQGLKTSYHGNINELFVSNMGLYAQGTKSLSSDNNFLKSHDAKRSSPDPATNKSSDSKPLSSTLKGGVVAVLPDVLEFIYQLASNKSSRNIDSIQNELCKILKNFGESLVSEELPLYKEITLIEQGVEEIIPIIGELIQAYCDDEPTEDLLLKLMIRLLTLFMECATPLVVACLTPYIGTTAASIVIGFGIKRLTSFLRSATP